MKHEKEQYPNKYHEAISRCEQKGYTLIFKSKGVMDVVNKNNNNVIHYSNAHSVFEILHWLDNIDNKNKF